MFDPQFRLSPDVLPSSSSTDGLPLQQGPWQQMSLDRLLEHHDITPAKPISINDSSSNDIWSTSGQFNEYLANYQRQQQPLDIASLLSSSPPQPTPIHRPLQKQQQTFQMQSVDNHIFEPPSDVQPLFYDPYGPDKHQISMRRESYYQTPPSFNPYGNRSRQMQNVHQRAPPVLQIPAEENFGQSSTLATRHRQNPMPAYVACLNHGINYNGVSGPPILLPPSF